MKIILTIFFLNLWSIVLAQNNHFIFYQDTIGKVYFNIRQEGLRLIEGCYFPESDIIDSTIYNGVTPLRMKRSHIFNDRDKRLTYQKKFSKPIPVSDNCFYKDRIYSENIEEYTVYMIDSAGTVLEKSFRISKEKYQLPNEIPLQKWKSSQNKLLLNIKEIVVTASKKKEKKKCRFIVGDLLLYNKEGYYKEDIAHPFFCKFNQKTYSPPCITSDMSDYILTSSMSYHDASINIFPQYKEEEDFILYFYDKMFSHYPFYNDNDLKKEYKLAQYKKIRQEGTSIQVKLDSLSTFLKTFDDSHLYIPKTEREHLSGPVRLYKILDEIYIAAVFDTTLVLKPGMKLLKIDQKPVQSILDSTIACFHGNYRLRQQKAISNLLRRAKNDSCILTVQDETDKVSQHIIKYNRPLFIPDNFLHENLEVKRINKSTTYVFVKEFYLGSFLHLLNYKNLLEETNNLILDFRNNNRGVGIELIRWASLFIRKPTVFEHEIFQWDDDNQIKESLIIKPNRYLYLGCKNIIVLINGKTECASELLIGFLKDKTNAFVVGNENTSGELAAAGFITLKSNRKLFLNSDVKKLLSDKTSVRQEGIEPDVWVSINCIEDLAPYNDKILTIALKMTIDQENGN